MSGARGDWPCVRWPWLATAVAAGLLALSCGGGADQVAPFCESVHSLDLADAAALEVDTTDRAEVRAQLQRLAAKTDDLLAVAPDEVAPDVEVLAGVVGDLYEAVVASEGQDPLTRAAAYVDAQAPWLDRLDASVARYRAFVIRNCTPAP